MLKYGKIFEIKNTSPDVFYNLSFSDIDCYDMMAIPPSAGIKFIYINSVKVAVKCSEGGWTVFQSRGQFGNPSEYFDRLWADYVNGFGVPGNITYMLSLILMYWGSSERLPFSKQYFCPLMKMCNVLQHMRMKL